MATITVRPRSNGTTAYRVSWREGGTRHGAQQSETFNRRGDADRFRAAVELAGQHWPPGWTPGRGYLPLPAGSPEDATPPPTTLLAFGQQYVRELTNASSGTRHRYLQQLRTLDAELAPILGGPVRVAAIREEHVRQWVNWRLVQPAGNSPKTISNYHGLLSAVLELAVRRGMLPDNPCRGHRLPTRLELAAEVPEGEFLSEQQFALLANCLADPVHAAAPCGAARRRLRRTPDGPVGTGQDRRLVEVAVGTGLRWGELTALQVHDLALDATPPTLAVRRAWKRNPPPGSEYHRPGVGAVYLGPPKTLRSRRTITVSAAVAALLRVQVRGKAPEDFVFTAPMGGPLRSAAWYERRWLRAVRLAQQRGLTLSPCFHSLRHSHAAWLISAGVPLPVIQQRLGHESITTTVNLYGGILPQAHAIADAAVDAALGGDCIATPGRPRGSDPVAPQADPDEDDPPAGVPVPVG